MIRPNLDAIEARARAATPGPWVAWHTAQGERGFDVCSADAEGLAEDDVADRLKERDAAHIAGMDPAATLALCAYIRQLEAERARLMASLGTGCEEP